MNWLTRFNASRRTRFWALSLTFSAIGIIAPSVAFGWSKWLPQPTGAPMATVSQVMHQVAEAATVTSLPANDLTAVVNNKFWATGSESIANCALLRPAPVSAYPGSSVCGTLGDPTSKRLVVLVGDSHAFVFTGALDAIGKAEHFRVQIIASDACQFASIWSGDTCQKHINFEINTINALKPSAVIVSDLDLTNPYHPVTLQQYQADQEKSYRAIAAPGRLIIQLGNTPTPSVTNPLLANMAGCVTRFTASLQRCALSVQSQNAGLNWYQGAWAKDAGVKFVPLTPLFCTATTCPAVIDNTLVYISDHVNGAYWRLLVPALAFKLAGAGLQ